MRLKPGSIVTFLCLSATFSFVCFTAWSRSGDAMKWKVLNLTSKLPLHLTNIHYYLPHLREHENSLYPNVVIGQGRTGVSLVMGIPTVKRGKQNYLLSTLNSLFYEMSAEQKNDCVVVIFVAEVNAEYVNSIAESVRTSFPNEVQSGIIEVISPLASYYPDLSNLKETFGDSKERVRWRTKQNLDYSFLMLYAQPKGTFYLQLEDDIVAKPQYIQKIKNFALEQPSDEWMILEFSQLGFIGKLFRTKDLPLIVEFFLMFYKDKPIDWLLDHLLWVKVCSPEKDPKHCEGQKAYLRIRSKPSLFQHVGIHSSLAGKIQNLKDKDFGKNMLHKAHVNPPAKVTTSLRIFQHYTLEKAYEGMDCFWAFSPVAGDYILFTFLQPLKVEGYLFRSGNMEHPGDKLFNTTVEVWPAAETELLKDAVGHGGKVNYQTTKDGYLKIGTFDNGIAEGIISPSVGKIQAIRLSIHSDSPVWALLSEGSMLCGKKSTLLNYVTSCIRKGSSMWSFLIPVHNYC
ncbi:alpha-1,3-mannosyl-glycoprotein 4-beta-N-acetylglucosaminyltransferase-like protein MGAT4D isoform X5 [Malaclemys terrapin pileata]|uniref:alpha-1,3-mannosyl-glycoprotein 4-beta-N-acetylglucosaminyltransferase-like protein MGAT4D isoform X5 n=1 Tax=Malaclemys terrapin pileata TaxID=2991368 RepID=UPI0023A896DA|nr:alpha-1,3-mannosyl-glycoprotein 4-beta-N-acetylglucosaminyltransferase-like protein MGAT4D isoform X5 [Malaclemys terrapin pileata]